MATGHLDFRDDIQGLRALAIIPILFFHAGIGAIPGGYLGVDVFFVISGFLITRIIYQDLERGRFSFLEFYKRRAARIFPALIVMLIVTMTVSMAFLYRPVILANAPTAAAAAVFIANIYLWRHTAYFSPTAGEQTYLHTWSLGIEEQFYLFLPVILFLLYRYFRPWIGVAIILAVLSSFACSWLLYMHGPTTAFFLLPSRAWQLGLGSAVALSLFPAIRRKGLRECTAMSGLVLICGSFLLIGEDWQIPAPWSLPASLGAALLIAYGRDAATSRLLSLPPLAWIGRISYSLYLWHWPIIVLYRMKYWPGTSIAESALLIVASVLIATGSYYLVEEPAKRRLRTVASGRVVGVSAAIMVAVAGLVLLMPRLPQSWSPFSPEARRLASYIGYPDSPGFDAQYRRGTCFVDSEARRYAFDLCTAQDESKPTIALIGDSHAAQYYLALRRYFPNHNIIQVTASSCRMLLDVPLSNPCATLRDMFYHELINRRHIDRIILVENWDAAHLPWMADTLALLRERRIPTTIIGPVQRYVRSFPLLLANAHEAGDMTSVDKYRAPVVQLDHALAKIARNAGADYYSVLDVECPNGRCRHFAQPGIPIHSDHDHLTRSGAELLLAKLPPQ